ncbi:hypothetical protein ABKV19_020076 [Rosa sericea]
MDGLWLFQRYHNHSDIYDDSRRASPTICPAKRPSPLSPARSSSSSNPFKGLASIRKLAFVTTSILGSPWIAVIAAVPVSLCYCFSVIGQWRAGLLLLPSNHQGIKAEAPVGCSHSHLCYSLFFS